MLAAGISLIAVPWLLLAAWLDADSRHHSCGQVSIRQAADMVLHLIDWVMQHQCCQGVNSKSYVRLRPGCALHRREALLTC